MDLSISQLMALQQSQYDAHKGTWEPREPEYGKDHILFMMEEVGETIAILKKKGRAAVMEDPDVRGAFVEELADVLMYYTDVLMCYHVTPEEISRAYQNKAERNIHRNYTREYKELYHNG